MSQIPKGIDAVHETDVLVLGGGASGCGAALAAREAGLSVLVADKGKFESCGCIGGGNDHFMAVLNQGEHDSVDEMVKFYAKPGSGLHPETVRAWGEAMPHLLDFLSGVGVQFRKNPDGSYMRTQGFGQPGHWWILIRQGQFIKPLVSARLRDMGVDVLEHVMLTRLMVENGRMAGAMGYNVLDGSFHVIRAKTAVIALGPRAARVSSNSTKNPFNAQFPPFNTGAHYVLAYESGARLVCLDTRQNATVLPKSFGCPGMNGITGSGSHALNYRGERFMPRYHPMNEQAPRHLFVQGMFREGLEGNGPPFYMDMRHLPDDVRTVLEHDLMPGDKATWEDYSAQRGLDFTTKLMEVEVGDLALEGMVDRDAHFESSVPGLFVGTGFHAFSGAMCGGYAAGVNAAKAARMAEAPGAFDVEAAVEEKRRALKPLHSNGDTPYALFERAIRQVMDYYMGYVRNERGMKTALESLDRIAELKDDLRADNWHELMRTHEALQLHTMCTLATLASLERRETSSATIAMRTDYPNPDPSMNRLLSIARVNGKPHLAWL